MSISPLQNSTNFGLTPVELRFVVVGREWSDRFIMERLRLVQVLGSRAVDIQHIGSTAVPGITAKPILDIGVAIRDFESSRNLEIPLGTVGYKHFFEDGNRIVYTFGGERITHHLHLFKPDSWEWQRHLHFRDRLLASPELAARYSQLKLEAAKHSNGDRNRYQDLKSSFIEELQNP